MAAAGADIVVEVVLALPDRQQVARMELPAGSRVRDALEASGMPLSMPWAAARGGEVVDLDLPLADGDRIDICRPLAADPKEARRARARRRR
ncbi:MAG: RnfH family protein [Bradyrhizobium sp.]|uniref:RnfH family protein n=1 Tax=Bradyrhizobium sp. TaxID=376 RepID=UPI003D099EBD